MAYREYEEGQFIKKDTSRFEIGLGLGEFLFFLLFLLIITNSVGKFMRCVFAQDCSGW